MTSTNYLVTQHKDEDHKRHIYCDSVDDLLYYAGIFYLFHDRSSDPTYILEIVANGHELEYAGWLPNQIVKFRDASTKEIIWTKQF